jgi:acetyl-CoA synthetase
METAAFFAKAPPPRARGIAVAATSGGVAIMAADKAEANRVPLPQPAPATRAVLESRIPDYGSARNPCDVTAQVITDPESLNACAGALLADPAYAALLVPSVYAYAPAVRRIALLDALAAQHGKIICNVWVNEHLEGPGTREAEVAPHSALFRSLDRCFATLAAWQQRAETLAAAAPPAASPISPAARDQVAAALRAARGGSIGEHAAKALLALYGLPVVGEQLVASADAAVAAAAAIGGPVALKVESPDLPHKSEAGVIRLDLSGEAAVRAGYAAILDKARHASARVAGVLVQPMITGGVEMLLGVRVDPLFGPLIVVGLGGVLTEVLRDTATELAPLGPAQARAMLERLHGVALLRGFRGGPVIDFDALAATICRLGAFAADHAGLLREIDINPLICTGERLLAVDALIVTAACESGKSDAIAG